MDAKLLARIQELVNSKMFDLRYWVGSDESARDRERETKGMTKGELVVWIIEDEFGDVDELVD